MESSQQNVVIVVHLDINAKQHSLFHCNYITQSTPFLEQKTKKKKPTTTKKELQFPSFFVTRILQFVNIPQFSSCAFPITRTAALSGSKKQAMIM